MEFPVKYDAPLKFLPNDDGGISIRVPHDPWPVQVKLDAEEVRQLHDFLTKHINDSKKKGK